MESGGERLPSDIRLLVGSFERGLTKVLARNLAGIYLYGSSSTEGPNARHSGDVDFFVVTHRPLRKSELTAIGRLHRELAVGLRFGDDMDGLYITSRSARSKGELVGLGFTSSGRPRKATDRTWALDRAHLRGGACVIVRGPAPRRVFAAVSWREIARELDQELRSIDESLHRHPAFCALNLCRLMYSWETRDPVISKRAASKWAERRLPTRWRRTARSALRIYDHRGTPSDREQLAGELTEFFEFASRWIEEAKLVRRARSAP